MPSSKIKGVLVKPFRSWGRSDTVLIWLWAFAVAGAFTFYEIYFNNESQHPGGKFWTDRVPGYFMMTLVFTGVILGLSTLNPRLRGWLGLLMTSIGASSLFAFLVSSGLDWWDRLLLGRNLVVLTTLYLLPPYLMATLIHFRAGSSR